LTCEWEKCFTYNAIQNKKFVVNKIVIKIFYVIYHYDSPSCYFFVDFLRFSKFLQRLLCPQSTQVLENIVQFSCRRFSQTEHFIQSYSCFVTCIPYYFCTSHCHHFVRITSVRIVNHFLEIILYAFDFLFLLLDDWRTSENLPMELCLNPWWP